MLNGCVVIARLRVDGERAEAIGFLSHDDVDEETLQLYTVKPGSTGKLPCPSVTLHDPFVSAVCI